MAISGLKINRSTSRSVEFEFVLENLKEIPVTMDGQSYVLFRFKGGISHEKAGDPALPFIETRIAVPPGAPISAQVSVLSAEERFRTDVMPLTQVYIGKQVVEGPRNEKVYRSATPYPEDWIQVSKPYLFRGVNVVSVRLYPIRYFPLEHRVKIARRLRIVIQFPFQQTLTPPVGLTSAREVWLAGKILNYRQAAYFTQPPPGTFRKVSVNYDFSSGQWFRIPITEEGIYRVTGSQLKSAGVSLSSVQISNVHLYNYGGYRLPYNVNKSRPGDLNEIAIQVVDNNQDGIFDENDAVIFYGKGLGGWKFVSPSNTRQWKYYGHPYDDTNYYLLSLDGQPGKRIKSLPSPQLVNPQIPGAFRDYFRIEEDKYNILSSGLDWYWLKLTGVEDQETVSFTLPGNLANAKTQLFFKFKGGSGSLYDDITSYRYNLSAIVNGETMFDNLIFYRNGADSIMIERDTLFAVRSGNNNFTVQHSGNNEGCEVYLDFLEIYAWRRFRAENKFLRYRYYLDGNQPVEFRISGMPGGSNKVWDITDFANVREIQPLQNGSTVIFQDTTSSGKAGEYFVFSPEAVKTVSSLQPIENHPNLRDPARKAEFIIITPDEFYDQAEFLETLRETQPRHPLQTERVRLSEIFLEFASSVRDVTALRDFLYYAYQNWSDTLKYVLLFGDGHFDYRGILYDTPNYIPPFEITSSGEVYSRESDNYYVAFGTTGTSEIDPWLPIGRLPVNNGDEIAVYRAKAENYARAYALYPEKNGWQTVATLVADDEFGKSGINNEWFHMEATETLNNKYLPGKFNRTKIYLHDYEKVPGGLGRWKPKATEDLIGQINRGTLLINFFGHGNPDTWAHESVLNRSRDLPKFHNEYRLALWTAATCTWGKYDDPGRVSMSEELVWFPNGGAIGVISASRLVFVGSNEQLVFDFYKSLFYNHSEVRHSRPVGEALYQAMHGGSNYQKYHLFGDPTTRLADPEYQVHIQTIEPDTQKALSTVTVGATVTDENGNPMPEFEGMAVLQVFDAVDSMTVQTGTNSYLNYVYRGGTIFKGLVSVKQGNLTGKFIVPKSIKYKLSPTGRLSIYAWEESGADAIGFVDTLLFYGTETQVNDQTGPEIEVSFKDAPDFFNGDFVSSQPTLMLEIRDENGINLTGEVGHKIEIVIDDVLKKDITEYFVYEVDSYQRGKLEYTLPVLSSGTHTLKITCWDNLNNYSETEVTFRTSQEKELRIVNAVNYPNPFERETYFVFELNKPVVSADVTISVYTVTGRKIQELREVVHSEGGSFYRIYWDGLDWDGDIIANGVYLYKIVVDDGENRVERIEKLAVVR